MYINLLEDKIDVIIIFLWRNFMIIYERNDEWLLNNFNFKF